jgi:uncharacterized protein (TIGR03067 family)
MKWMVLGGLTLGSLVPAVGDNDATKRELAKLQGTWTVQSEESDLGARPKEDLKAERIIIQDNKWIRKGGHKEGGEALIELNPSQMPGAIDFVYPRAGENGKDLRILGRYRFDGDTLMIVTNAGGVERPDKFKTGKDTYVSVYQREQK